MDVVLREVFGQRQRGIRLDHAVWTRLITKEAGPMAKSDFEGIILRGDLTLIPASDAFGRCLARRDIRGSKPNYEWVRRQRTTEAECRSGLRLTA